MGLTRKDKVRNDSIRAEMGVRPINAKVQGSRLRWFGHVHRRSDDYCGKLAERINVAGKRGGGRRKTTWNSKIADDLKQLGIVADTALDRAKWRYETLMADPKSSGTTSTTK